MAIRSKQHLAALKIWDRRSCFITGVPNEFLKVDNLCSNEAFGLFGQIQHLRIIRMPPGDDSPSEVFIEYASSAAAQRAIQWCLETGIAAKHGFQRYCSKLLCSKPCKRRNCPNLHQWASVEDIMDTQSQCDHLQQQCSKQSRCINELMRQLDTLNEQHSELRKENSLLQHRSNSDVDHAHSEDAKFEEMVDNIVERLRDEEGNAGTPRYSADSSGSESKGSNSSSRHM